MYVLNWQRTFRKHSPERTTCRLQSPWANRGELVWRGRNLLSTIVLFSWMTVVKKFPMLVQTIRHSHRMVALNYNRSFGWDSVITSEINQDAFGWRLHDNLDPLLGPERSPTNASHTTSSTKSQHCLGALCSLWHVNYLWLPTFEHNLLYIVKVISNKYAGL